MKNKLILLLGGVLKIEYSLLKVEYDGQRDLTISQRRQISDLEQRVNEEREERKRLQDLIFHKFGIVEEPYVGEMKEELEPIKTSPRNWSHLKVAMERDDLARANAGKS